MIVVASLERAAQSLLAGDMPCPRCQGALRPFGTVTPRRARCKDCWATQVLLPTELMVRRADSTEVIGNVLVAKSRGAGYGKHRRPLRASESTVRR